MQQGEQLRKHPEEVGALLREEPRLLQQRLAVVGGEVTYQGANPSLVDGAEHLAHRRLLQGAPAVGDGLVEQAQGIAHAAVGGPGQQAQRPLFETDLLGAEHLLQMRGDLLLGQPLEIELQAAGEHRHRQLLRIGGGEQELHVGWRLFQGLEEGVEAVVGEHVHLVHQIDLVAAPGGCVLDVLQQLAGVFHLGAGGGIHLDEIDETPLVDLAAGGALAARGRGDPLLAVERLGEDPGDGGLAHPPRAGEEKGVVQSIAVEGIDQGTQDVLLPDHLLEGARAPLSGQDLITHAGTGCSRKGGREAARGPRAEWPDSTTAGGGSPAWREGEREAARPSHTPAPESTAAAAPFRA